MKRKQALGFTLLELAVVILLISIFMGLGLSAVDVQQTNRAFSETREKQEKIKDALVTYLANFRRLPCPDTNPIGGAPPDGLEDRVGGVPTVPTNACVNGFGVIPYADLGLSRDDALDGWDNFFSYEVSHGVPNNEWALSTTFGPPANGFFTGNGGGITLNGRNAAGGVFALNPPLGAGPALGIAAIVVSHGRNGLGAYTTKGTQNQVPPPALVDEIDNTNDGNLVFFQREFTDVVGAAGGPFDDLVLALTPNDLLTPAIKDGALQSATAQTLSQIETIVDTAIGSVPTPPPPPCTGIPLNLTDMNFTVPGPVATDAWGQTINYVPNGPPPAGVTALSPPSAETPAFSVWSYGPDRAPGGGDDVGVRQVNYAQLRAAFSTGANPPCP